MLREVRARFECDRCGKEFSLRVEPSYVPPKGWSVYDVAEDAVRGSIDYEGPRCPEGFGGVSSVQDGEQLCGYCTRKRDKRKARTP